MRPSRGWRRLVSSPPVPLGGLVLSAPRRKVVQLARIPRYRVVVTLRARALKVFRRLSLPAAEQEAPANRMAAGDAIAVRHEPSQHAAQDRPQLRYVRRNVSFERDMLWPEGRNVEESFHDVGIEAFDVDVQDVE